MDGFPKVGAVLFVFPGVGLVCAGAAAAVTIEDEIKNPITSAETIAAADFPICDFHDSSSMNTYKP